MPRIEAIAVADVPTNYLSLLSGKPFDVSDTWKMLCARLVQLGTFILSLWQF